MARAPTTSSSQLAGRNEANEDDEEELLDDVPFAAVSRLRSVRFPISLLSSGMHLQLLVLLFSNKDLSSLSDLGNKAGLMPHFLPKSS